MWIMFQVDLKTGCGCSIESITPHLTTCETIITSSSHHQPYQSITRYHHPHQTATSLRPPRETCSGPLSGLTPTHQHQKPLSPSYATIATTT